MGGDEFVLVLAGLEPSNLAEKVRRLERVAIEAGEAICGERLLNISVGAACCPEHGVDAEGLLAEADRRMYLAKQSYKCAASSLATDLAALAAGVDGAAWDTLSQEDNLSRQTE